MTENKTLKEWLDKIELTQTQRDRAETLYTNICNYIQESGVDIDFYPQGSFATKTVVRPFKDGKDQAYDIDVICEVKDFKEMVTPKELKEKIGEILFSGRYKEKVTEHDKCFTVKFEKQDGVEFSIDIIPSVPESEEEKEELRVITEYDYLVESSIAIPHATEKEEYWITNNPKGYQTWFENQHLKYQNEFRTQILGRTEVYASLADIPENDVSNALTQAIKILKRSRDVYFSERESDNKPTSILITTLATKIARTSQSFVSLGLLKQIIKDLDIIYSIKEKRTTYNSLRDGISTPLLIRREGGKWLFNNPANGKDNIVDYWNDDNDNEKLFFEWVEYLKESIMAIEQSDNMEEREIVLDNIMQVNRQKSIKEHHEVKSTSLKPFNNGV